MTIFVIASLYNIRYISGAPQARVENMAEKDPSVTRSSGISEIGH
jgi:hypothetical protein